MREYKFRGQDSNGEWHYGYLVIELGATYIYEPVWEYYRGEYVKTDRFESFEVKSETVGQYLIIDVLEIYENDIIKISNQEFEAYRKVIFSNGCFVAIPISYKNKSGDDIEIDSWLLDTVRRTHKINVVGNIFDNPELLNK